MGEGAGVVMLEEYEHAKARGAKIYGEVKGYGLSGDAYHITAPSEDGDGGFRAMQMALKRAGPRAVRHRLRQRPWHLDHGRRHRSWARWSGFLGNAAAKTPMSSTKSSIGHLLGAAGAVEAIFCLLAMRDSIVPPTINLDNPDVDTAIDLVPLKAPEARGQCRHVQLLRLRRHQRRADPHQGQLADRVGMIRFLGILLVIALVVAGAFVWEGDKLRRRVSGAIPLVARDLAVIARASWNGPMPPGCSRTARASGDKTVVLIAPGDRVHDIAQHLADAGVVANAALFELDLRLRGCTAS